MMMMILAIICLVFAFIFMKMKKENGKAVMAILSTVAIVLTVVFGIGSFVRVVPTGHTGVVTTFGRVEDRT